MTKYYTRVCNFYHGEESLKKLKSKKALPLNGNKSISFDTIEIISRKNNKKIFFKDIKFLQKVQKIKVKNDLKKITKKKIFKKLDLLQSPILMGVLNLTPNSFSDGGRFNKKKKALSHIKEMVECGCKIVDIGGEATNPGSNDINETIEWKRIKSVLNEIKKKNYFISLDTRKSSIMKKGINNKVSLINDVSGLTYDKKTLEVLKTTKIPFVIHHMQGTPKTMQKNPKYKNVILDIYDFFYSKIKEIRKAGINHNNIILDPGIGFGKNLKHNITLIRNISIFHSLGFPIMLGISRKRFIKDISENNDSKYRIGGTISSSLYSMMQGVQILRVHDINEINQSIKVFKSLKF